MDTALSGNEIWYPPYNLPYIGINGLRVNYKVNILKKKYDRLNII